MRIEVGEVESALRRVCGVKEGVVEAREEEGRGMRLIGYVEMEEGEEKSEEEIREEVRRELAEWMTPGRIVRMEQMPQTANGKIDRKALPSPDSIQPVARNEFVAARTEIENRLARIWADVLRLDQVGVNDNFFELGGDSILAIQVVSRAYKAGLKLSPKQLFQFPTVEELATVATAARSANAEQGIVTGPVLLTPIQQWFFEQQLPDPHHWNQSIMLEAPVKLERPLMAAALRGLLEHHDALRMNFTLDESGWKALNSDLSDETPLWWIDLADVPEHERMSKLDETASALQASINLTTGPLVRAVVFQFGQDEPSRLLLIVHHLVTDGVSWRILIEDLETAYEQLSRGQAAQFPPKSTSFKQWASSLTEYAQSNELRQELSYWLEQSAKRTLSFSVDFQQGPNSEASAQTVSVSLGEEDTKSLLEDVSSVYRSQINEALLTALAITFCRATGQSALLLDLEGHGREEIIEGADISRTVGWFTSLFPVIVDTGRSDDAAAVLRTVKQQLRSIPNKGIGYGILRYLANDEQTRSLIENFPRADVSFNYLGQLDRALPGSSPFKAASESGGVARSQRANRRYLIDINAGVSQGRLNINWTYSENLHRRSTIHSLAQGFIDALNSLIAQCKTPQAESYTPSDFPDEALSQQDLENIFAQITAN
jgi:non-ribosomal peptide synthase protein (TIGR01720 family)